MKNPHFTDENVYYYNIVKTGWVKLVEDGANVILDLGCASGQLGKLLRENGKAGELIGVEIFEPAAKKAEEFYDKVHVGDLEKLDLPYENHFDYIFCGDILEHLIDPWEMVSKIYGWLKNNGTLISSIPNIRYWRVLMDIIFFGKWEYQEAGILDQTHMRFFTKSSFINLIEQNNFHILNADMKINGPKKSFFNFITFNIFDEFLGSQVIVIAQKIQ